MVKGDKINYLTMVSERTKGTHPTALFQCDCGNIKRIRVENVKIGSTKSCGCMWKRLRANVKPNYRHGGRHTRLYNIYNKMKARCYNPNYPESQYYGDRGIEICEEWRDSFESFRKWALENGYSDNLSIDRIDVNDGYSPSNCRWATDKEQSRNRRNVIVVDLDGNPVCLAEWCEKHDLPYETIRARIGRGWDVIDAVTKPIKRRA